MKLIERISITDSVVASIKNLILSGKYQIGDKLPTEQQLCSELGVSRTSVREAVRVLQTMKYIENRPGRGSFVGKVVDDEDLSEYDANDIGYRDLMIARAALEPVAVQLAIIRATEEDIHTLEILHKQFIEAVEKKDVVKMMIGDEAFHKQIFAMTQNKLFINFNRKISEVYLIYRKQSFANETIYRNAIEPHARILQFIKNRDVQGAMKEMSKHMELAEKDMDKIHNKL